MKLKSQPERCPVCRRRVTRSHQANALYWSLLGLMASKLRPGGHEYSADSYHTYYKAKFLGCDDIRLPNGKTVTIPKSTADLDVEAFGEYLDRVQADAADHGVFMDELPV